MVCKVRTACCRQCGTTFSGRFGADRLFCTVACRQAYRNHPDHNPARSDQARAKISAAMRGNTSCLGRTVSTATRQKIAAALCGRSQPAEMVAKRVAGWRKTAQAHGGMTPAHRQQLDGLHKSGPEHPGWKGGHTPQRVREFVSDAYKTFHAAVLARDNYTCQACGARSGTGAVVPLQVHHVQSYAEHANIRFEPANGVTLCLPCHNATKRGARRPLRGDFVPVPRLCAHCKQEFRARNPRRYCPACRPLICCPVCGSTVCHHSARRALPYYSQPH